MIRKVRNVTASAVLELWDDIIQTTPAAAMTLTVPTAGLRKGKQWEIKDDGSAATYNITISGAGSELIDGASSYVMNINYQAIRIFPNKLKTAWLVA